MSRPPGPSSGLSDSSLVASAREGQAWAREALYRRYVKMVFATAYKMTPWDAEVEDIVQEVFLNVFERLDQLDDPDSFGGWLKTTTIRLAWQIGRKRKRRARLGLVTSAAVDPDRIISSEASPETKVALRKALLQLRKLSPDLRIIWSLRKIEEYQLDEIAEVMNISRSTVKRRLAAAERRLKEGAGNG